MLLEEKSVYVADQMTHKEQTVLLGRYHWEVLLYALTRDTIKDRFSGKYLNGDYRLHFLVLAVAENIQVYP